FWWGWSWCCMHTCAPRGSRAFTGHRLSVLSDRYKPPSTEYRVPSTEYREPITDNREPVALLLPPDVVPAPHVREAMPRIDFHLHHVRAHRPLVHERVAEVPDLDRQPHVLGGPARVGEPQLHRHGERPGTREVHPGDLLAR